MDFHVNFNPDDVIFATIGGLIIGLASTINLTLTGRVTGMSGIFNGLITQDKKTFKVKLVTFLGMLSATCLLYLRFSH